MCDVCVCVALAVVRMYCSTQPLSHIISGSQAQGTLPHFYISCYLPGQVSPAIPMKTKALFYEAWMWF